jgi:pyridoxamine 5'-phosphate oxidase
MNRSIEKIRFEYGNEPLLEACLLKDPVLQFSKWFKEACQSDVFEPNGMILSTITSANRPSSRVVLLKKVSAEGFCFYSNCKSRKGEHLSLHPYASLTFWWKEIYRQVNIEGSIKKMEKKEVVRYFSKRPKGAQIAAIASEQSQPLASRDELEEVFRRLSKKYRGGKVPCPSDWCGYCLEPERVEFWQGRANRLHDRFLYAKTDGEWIISRLSP